MFNEQMMGSKGFVGNMPHQMHPDTFSMAGSQYSGQQGHELGGHGFRGRSGDRSQPQGSAVQGKG